ncbi:Hypothetical predicted protein [Podarcis lilfordi]|uniref:Uncharacterized protein n=1 Tax=Podarcis lilfordi TaxID=74358 RepID=A0AA35KK75_9SAUR|nr:Hypothetical predicted protein [Podarcis lilfordi]
MQASGGIEKESCLIKWLAKQGKDDMRIRAVGKRRRLILATSCKIIIRGEKLLLFCRN